MLPANLQEQNATEHKRDEKARHAQQWMAKDEGLNIGGANDARSHKQSCGNDADNEFVDHGVDFAQRLFRTDDFQIELGAALYAELEQARECRWNLHSSLCTFINSAHAVAHFFFEVKVIEHLTRKVRADDLN